MSIMKQIRLDIAINLEARSEALLMENTITGLQQGHAAMFETLFKDHFKGLHAYACTITNDAAAAEDVVQQTFYKLWERRDTMGEIDSLPAYLYRSVYHASLNILKHNKVKTAHQQYAAQQMNNPGQHTTAPVGLRELEQRLDTALKELPEQCRTIFQMSRFEDLKYREIADKLGLSVKTIEAQMGKALRLLRMKLVDYLPATLLLLLHL